MIIGREVITSPQNQYVSLARGLANKKNREKDKLFRFDGIKLMCEAVKKDIEISFVLVEENKWSFVTEKAEKLYGIRENELNFKAFTVSESIFSKLSEEMAPEGVICVAKYAESIHREIENDQLSLIPKSEKILLLESVRDPQNVGAILRVAAAFGVDRVVMSSDCADIYNSKTIRASMGTVFGTRVDQISDMPCTVKELRKCGRRVFAAALHMDSRKLGGFEIESGDCVIIGNEGHGLSSETIDACDGTVFIPMADGVESLNAATAAAVLVWEFFGKKTEGGNLDE